MFASKCRSQTVIVHCPIFDPLIHVSEFGTEGQRKGSKQRTVFYTMNLARKCEIVQ